MEVEKNSGYVKYRCRIIGRQISIKVLWESFYPNIPIKSDQTLDCVYHLLGLIHHHFPCPLSSSHVRTFFRSRFVSQSPIWDLK